MITIMIITTKSITELNELIYTGAKLVWDKIGVSLMNTNRNIKPGWDIRLETSIRNLRLVKMLRKRKTRGYVGRKREKQHSN